MLKKISVVPLAAESLGVRSMCTFVETPDVKILFDAGVSICPKRFGLPPHPAEFRVIEKIRKQITEAANKAEVVTVSHYHFDHHTPSYEDWLVNWTEKNETARQIYEGKTVLIKNPHESINSSQRKRAWFFQKTGGRFASELDIADNNSFSFGKNTILKFSEPVFHGFDNSPVGWVIIALVEYKEEKLVFAPDVQGPMSLNPLDFILKTKPQMLIVGGPPFYLSNVKVSKTKLQLGVRNLIKIVKEVPVTILEHHTLRDELWRKKTEKICDAASSVGHSVLTAAEFRHKENSLLECNRKKLYREDPPSSEFMQWTQLDLATKSRSKPPI